jgi:ABC-type multidrug transport system ATPase subunit
MLEVSNVLCGYGAKPVLSISALSLPSEGVMAVIGRSGAGKSTFLASLSGMLPLLRGEIRLDGQTANTDRLRRDVARTLQSFPLLHWLTVRQNLLLAARIRKTAVPDPDALLGRFSAAHLAGRYPKELSGGERARASLAQAGVSKPKLLLLDEPLTGLDPVVKIEVSNALFHFAKSEGAAVIFVTHDLSDAISHAQKIAVVASGAKGEPNSISTIFDAKDPNVQESIMTILRGSDI